MDYRVKEILAFLKDLAAHNNREWFAENKFRYEEVKSLFHILVQDLILSISSFDESVKHLQVKDCTYRIYRDIRFSQDKTPYKQHIGAYINAKGKKSLHGGYYLHLEPDNCFLAGGAYCLPPKVLFRIREEIVDEIDSFRAIVESDSFHHYFKQIGETRLKTLPKGFPKEFPFPQYLQPKDYAVSTPVEDSFFFSDCWLQKCTEIFAILKPYLDFINRPIDDMEEAGDSFGI